MRRSRASLLVAFGGQGLAFGILVTRIPALQRHYGFSDGTLTLLLAMVPLLAGVGSVVCDQLVRRVAPRLVLRVAQPAVCVSLALVGFGDRAWQAFSVLAVCGVSIGFLDATQNMLGVGLQRLYGRSIMLGFHAAYSFGGIIGASWAWAGAHWQLPLSTVFGVTAAVVVPVGAVASVWFPRRADGDAGATAGTVAVAALPWRPLAALCAVMTFVYIGDSTVSNWSAKYLQDTLGSSDQLSTVPYNAYMVVSLFGRTFGDLLVRQIGAVRVVRFGAVLGVLGFGLVAAAPGPWFGLGGFVVLGLGLCTLVPQVFAAGGQRFPGNSDTAVARLNVFNYLGFLIGSPLVGVIGDVFDYRAAMVVPMVLVGAVLLLAKAFTLVPADAETDTDTDPGHWSAAPRISTGEPPGGSGA
jgi:MFS family permease